MSISETHRKSSNPVKLSEPSTAEILLAAYERIKEKVLNYRSSLISEPLPGAEKSKVLQVTVGDLREMVDLARQCNLIGDAREEDAYYKIGNGSGDGIAQLKQVDDTLGVLTAPPKNRQNNPAAGWGIG